MDGFLCVNKPCGPSSFKIVDQLRRILHTKKIGHAGTLDPQATGLLVIAVGAATRLLQYIPAEPKKYDFGIQFGSQTDTLDRVGAVVNSGGRIPEKDEIDNVLIKFTGEIEQVPPVYSAISINGVRAYKLARNGIDLQMQSRALTIYSITLNSFDSIKGEAHLSVECSGGTYVRSIARDIASELGTFGFASYVHRTAAGKFRLEDAVSAENLDLSAQFIVPFDKIFNKDSVVISEEQKQELIFGRDIEISASDSEIVFAFCNGVIAAVMKRVEGAVYHPAAMLANGVGKQ